MITSAGNERIMDVRVTDDELVVALADGRTLSVPLVWYPRLLNASAEQRSDWRLIGDGEGVHWPQIDEDLSAAGLLRGVPAPAAERAGSSSVLEPEATRRSTIGSVLEIVRHGAEFEIYKDQDNPQEFRWRLRANNGEIIADSGEGYNDRDDCEHGIDLVKSQSPSATLQDLT
jgi:uncharacterized protein YegP (UPF0339 family)